MAAGLSSYAEANAVQRGLRQLVASGPGSRVAARLLHRVDGPVFRATRGRHTLSSLVSGLPVVFLTTTGARSGQPRTVPLLGVPTAEGLAVIASNFGQARHPAWYHNLRANPEGELSVDGRRRRFRAVEAEGERRQRIWDEGLKLYPGWTTYERRAKDRRIVVFVLEPVDGSSQ
jgi:deazaflavin-dependent oxidoreductase (nitroreductase family)